MQDREIKTLREEIPEYKDVSFQVLEDVLDRLDKAFQAFFRRVKMGEKPGYPRFRGKDRYDSFAFRQNSFKFDGGKRLFLSKIGHVKLKAWCQLPGETKKVTIQKKADGWYATFVCNNVIIEPIPQTSHSIGLDLGLSTLVMTSDGEALGTLEHIKKAEKELREIQRDLSRKQPGSNRWKKCESQLAKKHLQFQRVRKYQLDCLSKKLVKENDTIAVEDLNTKAIIALPNSNKGLRRNIHLASWATFTKMLSYKAEDAGKRLVKVNPKNTTQECSGCGEIVPKKLWDRVHNCPHCGLVLDRDHNAAINVLNRGLRLLRGGLLPVGRVPVKRKYRKSGGSIAAA